METAQQSERCSGTADYYSQRNLHPRTGDHNAFTGRTSQQSISPRSEFHEDLWATDSSFHEPLDHEPVPGNADVELEGVTADGGMALNVEFASGDDVQEPSAACAEQEDVLPAERQQVADHVLLSASCSMLSYCMYLSITKAFETCLVQCPLHYHVHNYIKQVQDSLAACKCCSTPAQATRQ